MGVAGAAVPECILQHYEQGLLPGRVQAITACLGNSLVDERLQIGLADVSGFLRKMRRISRSIPDTKS